MQSEVTWVGEILRQGKVACGNRVVPIVLVLLSGIPLGCDSGPRLPPLAKVSGVVTLDGQPLTHGNVQFVPVAPPEQNAPTSVAEIGPDGKYELETQGKKGAMVGTHTVRVECTKPPRDETDTQPASLIPMDYNNPATSGLSVEVKADQENNIPLNLVSKRQR